jgi:hypothetical protein
MNIIAHAGVSPALPEILLGFSEFDARDIVKHRNCVRPLNEFRSVTAICRGRRWHRSTKRRTLTERQPLSVGRRLRGASNFRVRCYPFCSPCRSRGLTVVGLRRFQRRFNPRVPISGMPRTSSVRPRPMPRVAHRQSSRPPSAAASRPATRRSRRGRRDARVGEPPAASPA